MASTRTEPVSAPTLDPIPHSRVQGIAWPALVGEAGARALALQYQLLRSQWWPPDTLRAQQRRQLALLAAHAAETVPHYRGVLPRGLVGGDGVLDWDRWAQVPILTRAAVQSAGSDLLSGFVPPEHGSHSTVRASGSSGRMVTIETTALTGLLGRALALRDHLWHRRDLSGKQAGIHSYRDVERIPAGGQRRSGWGPVTDLAYDTGESVGLTLMSISRRRPTGCAARSRTIC